MSWVCCLGPELLDQSQFVASFSLQSPHSSQAVLWLLLCSASSHLSAYYQESVMDAEAHWCGSPDHPRAIRLLPCSNFCRWLMLPSCFQFLISLQTTILWGVSQLLLTLAFLSPNVPSIHPHHYPWSLHLKKMSAAPVFPPPRQLADTPHGLKTTGREQQSWITPNNLQRPVSTQQIHHRVFLVLQGYAVVHKPIPGLLLCNLMSIRNTQ